jgi:hypothetical protein
MLHGSFRSASVVSQLTLLPLVVARHAFGPLHVCATTISSFAPQASCALPSFEHAARRPLQGSPGVASGSSGPEVTAMRAVPAKMSSTAMPTPTMATLAETSAMTRMARLTSPVAGLCGAEGSGAG